jgi:hypothetical protein
MTTSVREQVNAQVTGRRVVATLLDGLVLGLAYGMVAWAFGTVTTVGPYSWTAETSTVPTLLYALGAFAYFALMEGYRGQTLERCRHARGDHSVIVTSSAAVHRSRLAAGSGTAAA